MQYFRFLPDPAKLRKEARWSGPTALHLHRDRQISTWKQVVIAITPLATVSDRNCDSQGDSAVVSNYLSDLYSNGFSPKHTLAIVEALLEARTSAEPLSHILELIVSGPDVPGVPVGDTFAAMHTLVQRAEREVILAGYSIYNGRTVFRSLAERMDSKPYLRVLFLVHIGRDGKDTTIEADLVARYARHFVSENWPGQRIPEMYYDPRGLEMVPALRANFQSQMLIGGRRIGSHYFRQLYDGRPEEKRRGWG